MILATRTFLRGELRDSDVNISRVLSSETRAYQTLEIPVPKFNGKDFVVYHAKCTGLRKFRGGQSWSDWIWIRRRLASEETEPTGLNGCMPARLNALYKLAEASIDYPPVYEIPTTLA